MVVRMEVLPVMYITVKPTETTMLSTPGLGVAGSCNLTRPIMHGVCMAEGNRFALKLNLLKVVSFH